MIELDETVYTPPSAAAHDIFKCPICNELDDNPVLLHGVKLCFDCHVKALRETAGLFVSGNTILNTETVVAYVIQQIIQASTTGMIFGPSGSGKSFITLDKCLCIATGTDWNGKKVKRGIVIYLAGEGIEGLKLRIKAWCKHHGVDDLSCFYLSTRTIPFDTEAIRQITTAAKEIESKTGYDVALIVIDTLARHMDGNENSTADMNRFVGVADAIRSEFTGSTALIVHHTGNNEEASHRARGASSLNAAMDFTMSCNKGLLSFTKMKDGTTPPQIAFKLRPVEIGTDPYGNPITSCIVEYGERAPRHQQTSLTSHEQQALSALVTVCVQENTCINGQYHGGVEAWRQEFYRLRRIEEPDAEQGTLKKAFQRATGSGNAGGGLKGKQLVAFLEAGAVPLRLAEQDKIKALAQDGTRDIDGT